MRITKVILRNFKGVSETVEIPLAPITLLFGVNSVGKSTILHALVYLYEVIVNRNYDADVTWLAGEALNLGGFKNLVHGKDDSEEITLGLELDVSDEILSDYLTEGENWLFDRESVTGLVAPVFSPDTVSFQITIGWSRALNMPYCHRLIFSADDNTMGWLETTSGHGKVSLHVNTQHLGLSEHLTEELNMGEYLVSCLERSVSEGNNLADVPLIGVSDALPSLGRMIDLDYFVWTLEGSENGLVEQLAVRSLLSQMIVAPLDKARILLQKLSYLGPLREVPPRNFSPLLGLIPSRWVDGSAAWDLLGKGDSEVLRGKVNEWLDGSDRLDSGYRLGVESGDQIYNPGIFLTQSKKGVRLSMGEVGVGLSQVIPVITAALYTEGGIVAVEQPELHIHPAWQLVLGDLFLQAAVEQEATFLLETHSEHLMLRILRRIREENENNDGEHAISPAPVDTDVSSDGIVSLEREVELSEVFKLQGESGLFRVQPDGELGEARFEIPRILDEKDKRIVIPSLQPDEIAILYVDQLEGETRFQRIRVDKEGEFLDKWPRGFFSERRGELL